MNNMLDIMSLFKPVFSLFNKQKFAQYLLIQGGQQEVSMLIQICKLLDTWGQFLC
jgi:hypothetical protein